MAAKKKAPAKRPAKKVAAKSSAKSKSASKSKSSAKSKSASKKTPTRKPATKRSASSAAKKTSSSKAKNPTDRIVIPAVPTRGTTAATVSTPPSTPPTVSTPPSTPTPAKKKTSPRVLILILIGLNVLAFFALSNKSSEEAMPDETTVTEAPSDPGMPTTEEPTADATPSEEPTAAPEPSANPGSTQEPPTNFVAIANKNGGVTLRWKAPANAADITGYAISVSYDAKTFTEVTTVAADARTYDMAKAGDEGGTQFLLQAVYSDGSKADAKKFSLKGKYQ